MKNQLEYTGLRQILIFSLFVGCFYRKGPALSSRYYLDGGHKQIPPASKRF